MLGFCFLGNSDHIHVGPRDIFATVPKTISYKPSTMLHIGHRI